MLVPTGERRVARFSTVKVIGSRTEKRFLFLVFTAVDNVDNSVDACRP